MTCLNFLEEYLMFEHEYFMLDLARLIYNFCAKYSSSLLHESILHSWHAGSHTHGEYID